MPKSVDKPLLEVLHSGFIGQGNKVDEFESKLANYFGNNKILSLNSKKIAITPISPFRPRRWKGKIVSDKTKIYISNIDPKKRPIAAVADNNEIRNIAKVKIVINKRIKCKLLFNSKESLIKKIKLEQKKQFN